MENLNTKGRKRMAANYSPDKIKDIYEVTTVKGGERD